MDVPIPYSFVECNMDPVAQFSIWIVSFGGGSFSGCFACCCDFLSCFGWYESIDPSDECLLVCH